MHTPRLTRRNLLVGAGAAAVLAACGGDDDGGTGQSTEAGTAGGTAPPVSQNEVVQQVAEAAGVQAPLDYTPLIASFENLTGAGRRFQFGLLDEAQSPVLDATLVAFLVADVDHSIVQGPVVPTFHDEGLGPRGIYVFDSEFAAPGTHYLVIQTEDRTHGGVAALTVVRPEDSPVPQIGAAMVSVATPTVDDPQDLESLCTRQPPCDMHADSLDTALAAGKPIVVTIATPQFCQTAICGPVVDVVLGARDQAGRDDIVWIHQEVFTDAGVTPTELVTTLGLPTEPWVFLVGPDGNIVDKFDGPATSDLVLAAVTEHL